MSQDQGAPPKKDLTGIMDLPQADPVHDPNAPDGSSPDEFNELQPVEQIDDFASLDQIGMMDHPVAEEQPPETSFLEDPPVLDQESILAPEEIAPPESPLIAELEAQPEPDPVLEEIPFIPDPPLPVLDELKSYSESKQEAPFEPGTRNEFNLLISGDFDPYSRDKLLLFLTENSIGVTSGELDFQIKSQRVLLPRISEFSGIKLIQDLRDTGLSFRLKRAENESDLIGDDGNSRSFHFESSNGQTMVEVPILPSNEYKPAEYEVLDSIRMVQYLRAEILEVEQSELFQELLDRMTEGLRRRAKLRGATALTHLNHRITPLRLPSQYQIELSASLLKRL